MWTKISTALFAVVLSCASPARTTAHPHAWIDITVAVSFDADGKASGLTETWIFDEFYTAFATEGYDGDGDGRPDADKLAELLSINIEALSDYDYFTRVESQGRAVPLGRATDAISHMDGNRLVMTFQVPFATSLSLDAASLQYAVFDPTYYSEVLHAEQADPVTLVNAPASCGYEVEPPNPHPEMVALAYALDQTQSAGDGLGLHFAEWVTVKCD